ncbi:hypothetical protein PVAP13_7KG140573 [Panicum virgatum]|uniref:Secreted protein n=1 Tax=Panicum virgatum TaxID=38727 RepID=A0A8T0QKP3_PANVG|nr:hypothetical protein PVAP13_7KG140573 [Panicum virgatum]
MLVLLSAGWCCIPVSVARCGRRRFGGFWSSGSSSTSSSSAPRPAMSLWGSSLSDLESVLVLQILSRLVQECAVGQWWRRPRFFILRLCLS